MTALVNSKMRFASPAKLRRTIALALAILILVAAATVFAVRNQADASTTTVIIPPAKAAMLMKAAAGDAVQDMRAVGEEAKFINAALPFNSGPILQARPFHMAGGDLDQRRAELCLTQAVYYEAGFEPAAGRRAVAQVVLNRTRHPAYPRSVCAVVYQRSANNVCQFTFVCDGALYRSPARGPWLEAQKIARAALAGYVEPSVGSATHYHANYVAPRWAPMLAKVAQLGQHIFYRWPGAWGQPAAFVGRYIGEPRDPLSLRPPPPVAGTDEALASADPAIAGPPIARAPNDVGGLLDTSKGWTLKIPGPDEDSAAARLIAAQEGRTPKPAQERVPTHAVAMAANPAS